MACSFQAASAAGLVLQCRPCPAGSQVFCPRGRDAQRCCNMHCPASRARAWGVLLCVQKWVWALGAAQGRRAPLKHTAAALRGGATRRHACQLSLLLFSECVLGIGVRRAHQPRCGGDMRGVSWLGSSDASCLWSCWGRSTFIFCSLAPTPACGLYRPLAAPACLLRTCLHLGHCCLLLWGRPRLCRCCKWRKPAESGRIIRRVQYVGTELVPRHPTSCASPWQGCMMYN
jgi:hypothetical protein